MKRIILITILILLTGCAPTIKEHKIRVPEFDLVVVSDSFRCADKITTGCITKTIELRHGKVVTLYEIKVSGWFEDGKIYPYPDELAHELRHLLHREDDIFAEPYHRN